MGECVVLVYMYTHVTHRVHTACVCLQALRVILGMVTTFTLTALPPKGSSFEETKSRAKTQACLISCKLKVNNTARLGIC